MKKIILSVFGMLVMAAGLQAQELIKDNVRRSDLVALEKRRCILAASILTEGITYRSVL